MVTEYYWVIAMCRVLLVLWIWIELLCPLTDDSASDDAQEGLVLNPTLHS